MTISISIEGDDFSVLYKKVRAFDKELGKSLRKRLTAAATPVRDDVRAAALSLPSSGGGASSYRKKRGTEGGGAKFRQGIAAATEIKVNPSTPGYFSIRIRVSGTKFAAKTGKNIKLPRYMEGLSKKSWRHPVYGNRNNWVSQQSHPYLIPTANRHKPAVQTAVQKALQDAVDAVLNSQI